LDEETANKAWKAVEEEAKRCQTAEEAVLLYNMFLGDRVLPTTVRKLAEDGRAQWKDRADKGLVRLGARWVTLDEVRNAKTQAHFLRSQGLEMVRLSQDQLGLEKLLEASKADPDSVQADFIIATVYAIVAKRFDKANHHYEICLKRDPNNVPVLNNLALVEVKIGQHRDAIQHWKTAAALRYDERIAQNLGRLFLQAGKRKIPMTKSVLDQLSDVYASLVVGKNVLAADKAQGWHYMLLPEEPPPEESVSPSQEVMSGSGTEVTACGTGFAIANQYVLTNRHITKGARGFSVTNPSQKGQQLPAKLVASSKDYDLAILHCEGLNCPALPIALETPRVHSDIVVAGFPDSDTFGAALKTAQGLIATPPNPSLGGMLQYNAIPSSGSAGGPVLDSMGNVVAIHCKSFSSMVSRYGAGLPMNRAYRFILESIPGYQLNPNRADLAWNEVGELAAKSLVVVLCKAPSQDVGLMQRVGDEFLEDTSCCLCNGLKRTKCPFRSCARGSVPKTETVVVGKTPQGADIYGTNTIRVPCPNCGGDGVVTCPGCNGSGVDMEVRLRIGPRRESTLPSSVLKRTGP
jgi:S1-C subfamily serine protease